MVLTQSVTLKSGCFFVSFSFSLKVFRFVFIFVLLILYLLLVTKDYVLMKINFDVTIVYNRTSPLFGWLFTLTSWMDHQFSIETLILGLENLSGAGNKYIPKG